MNTNAQTNKTARRKSMIDTQFQFESIQNLQKEGDVARKKHPEVSTLPLALMEQVGSFAKELRSRRSRDHMKAEVLKVACVAMRIYEES